MTNNEKICADINLMIKGRFSLVYYNVADLYASYDIDLLIKNKTELKRSIKSIEPVINDRFDYFLYLFIRKIVYMASLVRYITDAEKKSDYILITGAANKKIKEYDEEKIIQYINSHPEHIIDDDKNICVASKQLFQEKIKLLSEQAIIWIIKNDFNFIASNIINFSSIICESDCIIKSYFEKITEEDADENDLKIYYRTLCSICKDKKVICNEMYEGVVDSVLKKCNEIVSNIDSSEMGVFYLEALEYGYEFLKINGVKNIYEIKNTVENKNLIKDKYLLKYGTVYSYTCNIGEVFDECLKKNDLQSIIFSLTHKNFCPMVSVFSGTREESIIDIFSDIEHVDEYYTKTKQNHIDEIIAVCSSYYFVISSKMSLINDYLRYRYVHLCILNKILLTDEFCEEIYEMYRLTMDTLWYNGNFQNRYGACMNILSLTEKMLYTIYQKENPGEYCDDRLNRMLTSNRSILNVLGKDQAYSIAYFISDPSQIIGHDYRNKLAHWTQIKMKDVNNELVCKLLFLFDSIFNTVLFYYYSKTKNDENKNSKK